MQYKWKLLERDNIGCSCIRALSPVLYIEIPLFLHGNARAFAVHLDHTIKSGIENVKDATVHFVSLLLFISSASCSKCQRLF